jgi:hypothetical protein
MPLPAHTGGILVSYIAEGGCVASSAAYREISTWIWLTTSGLVGLRRSLARVYQRRECNPHCPYVHGPGEELCRSTFLGERVFCLHGGPGRAGNPGVYPAPGRGRAFKAGSAMHDKLTHGVCANGSLSLSCSHGKGANVQRVLRGGSWNNTTDWLRSSARNRNNTDNRNNNLGFRVFRAASPPLLARVRLPTVSRSVREGVHDPFSGLRRDGKAK